jgi:N6-L-threonylcarbamoyladenine synthase
MKILGIETSCDETAVCMLEANGGLTKAHFSVLGDALYSQAKTHAEYGGVFPQLAKREHARNLPLLLKKALEQAKLSKKQSKPLSKELDEKLIEILNREIGLFETTKEILESIEKPDIDAIAVTQGPGLEPALWVGINFARALGLAWNIPVIPTNHMEGHIVSPLLKEATNIEFPALALLISGGHTELVLINNWHEYKVIGKTRDDAVGEAFDKVARLLHLPYPGGPQISLLAEQARKEKLPREFKLPRPMLRTKDYDFSFSGIKTAVLYTLKDINQDMDDMPESLDRIRKDLAREFENAVTEVLVEKTRKALDEYNIKTLILGGGVIANTHIRAAFEILVKDYSETKLLIPNIKDSTDNAVMIAAAGYLHILAGKKGVDMIKAEGNLAFGAKV